MLKFLLSTFLLIVLPTFVYGNVSPLIKCLGHEELQFHTRKDTGPFYALNQKFINVVSGVNKIHLKKGYYEEICQKKTLSPSVHFLRVMLLHGTSIFIIDHANFRESARQLTVLGELEEELPHVFFQFISSIQSLAEDPHCLNKQIPELREIAEKYKYLEEELPLSRLLEDKGFITKVFRRLENIDQILKECQKTPLKKAK